MFAPDVVSLRQFYTSSLGEKVCAFIGQNIAELWPQVKGETVLGIGYCPSFLEPYRDQDGMVMICMPAHQGAAYWPPSRANLVFLSHESQLPLPENSVNRILLLHSVENSDQLPWMMQEVWRTLTPGGRVLAVVPNRLGLWARSSRSPFGYGRPFSMAQLRDLMTAHHFTLTRSSSALFIPPVRLKLLWRIADKIEKAGKWLCPFFGGVLLVEAEKQLYASIKQPVITRKGYPMPVPAIKPVLGINSFDK